MKYQAGSTELAAGASLVVEPARGRVALRTCPLLEGEPVYLLDFATSAAEIPSSARP